MARGKISSQNVALRFALGGVDGVRQLESETGETASENVLRNAVKLLEGNDAAALVELVNERHPASSGGRGRKAVQFGESREYTVGDNLLVLPNPWGFEKGSKITVTFHHDGMTVAQS